MPNAAIVAAALTDHSAHPWGLFIGGTDVIRQAALETIQVSEEGPGGESSMGFVIDDPSKAVTIADGVEVTFFNLAGDACLFRGRVASRTARPDFGGQGRTIQVRCDGIETLLDDYLPATTVPSGAWTAAAIGYLAHPGSTLKAPMVGFTDVMGLPFTVPGSFDYPIGTLVHPTLGTPAVNGLWTWDGGSLRQAISSLCEQSVFLTGGVGPISQYGVPVNVTVDFYNWLRAYLAVDTATHVPSDYSNLTVKDAYAGPIVAENLEYEASSADVVHEVYVKGFDAASSGWFGDGSGVRGKRTGIEDDTITTADAARTRAFGYFARQFAMARGELELTDWTPPTTVHAGSLLIITDAATDATGTYRIYSIDKTFHGSGRQDWRIAYGAFRPSMARTTLYVPVVR